MPYGFSSLVVLNWLYVLRIWNGTFVLQRYDEKWRCLEDLPYLYGR